MFDLIFFNGPIITQDPYNADPEVIAVKDGRIVYAGPEVGLSRPVRQVLAKSRTGSVFSHRLQGAEVRCINLKGKTLIPGFNDNHLHLLAMGMYYSQPNLAGMSCKEVVEYLKEYYAGIPEGELISGLGWDLTHCPDPDKRLLDTAFPDNPVALIQFSGHGAWVNSRMLKKMRIHTRTPDPKGGRIVRDRYGDPVGFLKDNAMDSIHQQRMSEANFNRRKREELFERAQGMLIRQGITSVQDNTWFPTTYQYFRKRAAAGTLDIRISSWHLGFKWYLAAWMDLFPAGDIRVHKGPWKYFLDGTFSTRTAWVTESYPGEAENFGMYVEPPESIRSIVRRHSRRGHQLAFHSIGDRTSKEIITAVEDAARDFPETLKLRHRIEHGQLITKDDIRRIAPAGIHISAQPSALLTPEKDIQILGEDRFMRAYPYRDLLDAGVHLSFGSDIPGEATFSPLLHIHHAVNREHPQRIEPHEALAAYTTGSARAEFMEDQKGVLKPGYLADMAVLSENPLSIEPKRIRDIEVELTVTDGKIVYQKE